MSEDGGEARVRVADCVCGALRVTLRGEPTRVNICSCLQCQRRSGSAFTYTAFFPEGAIVSIEGEHLSWRSSASDAGRWAECHFCPTCGTVVFNWMESMPGDIAIPAGTFADPDFPAPPKLYWSSKKHRWLSLPEAIEMLETQ